MPREPFVSIRPSALHPGEVCVTVTAPTQMMLDAIVQVRCKGIGNLHLTTPILCKDGHWAVFGRGKKAT